MATGTILEIPSAKIDSYTYTLHAWFHLWHANYMHCTHALINTCAHISKLYTASKCDALQIDQTYQSELNFMHDHAAVNCSYSYS